MRKRTQEKAVATLEQWLEVSRQGHRFLDLGDIEAARECLLKADLLHVRYSALAATTATVFTLEPVLN